MISLDTLPGIHTEDEPNRPSWRRLRLRHAKQRCFRMSVRHHHSHRLHRQKNGSSLPHLVVEPGIPEVRDENIVSILCDTHLFRCDIAQDPDTQSGAGEGVAINQDAASCRAPVHLPHFILKEQPQRFAQFQVHLLGKTSHIVMAFDNGSSNGKRLDDIGVIVPCASHLISFSLPASSSKRSINPFPIIFRFCSGSVTLPTPGRSVHGHLHRSRSVPGAHNSQVRFRTPYCAAVHD